MAPVQTKAGPPSLVSWLLRMVGFPARGLCSAPQQAAQVEMHSLLLSSEAAPTHSPGSLHPLVTGYPGNTEGLKGGGLTPTDCSLNPILCPPLG